MVTNVDNPQPQPQPVPTEDNQAIIHLKEAVSRGQHWYIALLEAINLWDRTEELHNGRTCRYVISGEALDWLLLAERLCDTLGGLLPVEEKSALFFEGKPPLDLPVEEFKRLIGDLKYHQYLNFFYGVTVEDALIMAVQQEVRKERWTWGYYKDHDSTAEAYRRIYGATRAILLRHFRQEKGYRQRESITISELKEFTYWLFRYRLKQCDKAKVASDTKKALAWLKHNSVRARMEKHDFKQEFVEVSPSGSEGTNRPAATENDTET